MLRARLHAAVIAIALGTAAALSPVYAASDPRSAPPSGLHIELPPVASVPRAAAHKDDQPPKLLRSVRPYYPPEYASRNVKGEILVEFTVDVDGCVRNAKAIQADDPRLAELAEQAVAQWLFFPGFKHGKLTAMPMRVPIKFQGNPAVAPTDPTATLDPNVAAAASRRGEGKAALEHKDFPTALTAYEAAIHLLPDQAEGYLGRAQVFAQQGREDDAIADFMQAATLDPANQPALDAYRKSLPDTPERHWSSVRYETFNLVWRTVYETYFDPTFGGVDWLAIREKYRLRLAEIHEHDPLLQLLQEMLGELRRTHFAIVPRDSTVFTPSERVRIGTTGAEVAFTDGGITVTEVRPGSPAATAGVRPGDRITQVDGHELAQGIERLTKAGMTESRSRLYVTQFVESRLSSAVGTAVKLQLASVGEDAKPRSVTLTCATNDAAWSEPIGFFPSMPIRCEATRNPNGIALLRFNTFVPPVMKQIRALLRQLEPGDGLIVDLRGNGGGISVMASGLCGWLCREEFVLGAMHQREGVSELGVYPQRHVFDGPIAILVDGRSASTSEILAAGLKERHRARVFGEPTAGAALPSLFKSLPTGDLFQFAIADVTTPSGALLEGNGVTPDAPQARTRADLAAGRDPVIEAATTWLNQQRAAKVAKVSSPRVSP